MWIWDFTPDFQRGRRTSSLGLPCARLFSTRYCGSHRPQGEDARRALEHKARCGISQATSGCGDIRKLQGRSDFDPTQSSLFRNWLFSEVWFLEFSRDACLLASGSADCTVRVRRAVGSAVLEAKSLGVVWVVRVQGGPGTHWQLLNTL